MKMVRPAYLKALQKAITLCALPSNGVGKMWKTNQILQALKVFEIGKEVIVIIV